MRLHWTEYFFWFGSPAIQALIAVIMVRRNLRRDYPMFFNYTVFQVISHVVMFILFHCSYNVYYCGYWTTSALGIFLGFAVIREIFLVSFKPYEALREFGEMIFSWCLLVLVIIAVLIAFMQGSADDGRIYLALTTGERSIRILQCGLVFFIFVFSRYLGISKRHPLFGIALGFGCFACIEMIALLLYDQYTAISLVTMRTTISGAYFASVVVWLGYSLAPAPSRRTEVIPQSDRWNYALSNIMHVPEPDGFINSIDRTVESLLGKQNGGPS
jgi:hypothetical protein